LAQGLERGPCARLRVKDAVLLIYRP